MTWVICSGCSFEIMQVYKQEGVVVEGLLQSMSVLTVVFIKANAEQMNDKGWLLL